MAALAFLDTHALTWLVAGKAKLFSPKAKRCVEAADALFISPMVLLELTYLWEIRRLGIPPDEILALAAGKLGVEIGSVSFGAAVQEAKGQSWTRDPFDRLIVGHAAVEQSKLVTKDETIRAHYPQAVW